MTTRTLLFLSLGLILGTTRVSPQGPGEDELAHDEKTFPLTRQLRVILIVETRSSISTLKSATRGEVWNTLLQSFRTQVFLTSADPDTSSAASEMCGSVEQLKASYNFSENSSQAGVSLLNGIAGGRGRAWEPGRSTRTISRRSAPAR